MTLSQRNQPKALKKKFSKLEQVVFYYIKEIYSNEMLCGSSGSLKLLY